jgi:predicted HAD superfamily Cof-like phosphohydrolase
MNACDQTTQSYNEQQYNLYCNLIREEYDELHAAITENNRVEQLDALTDILVVTIGAINSLGADGEGAWNEVMKTNFAKIDHETGKVRKRDDGKVLKPDGWRPPNLAEFILN